MLDDTTEIMRNALLLYPSIVVPEAIYNELTANADYKDEREVIVNCTFLSVEKVSDAESVNTLRNVTGLNAGESESLILYVLMQAFDERLITAEEIWKILEILLASDIGLSRKLCNKVLDYVGQENYF